MSALRRYCTCLVLVLLGTGASRPAAGQPSPDERWAATFRVLIQGRNVGSEHVSVTRDDGGLTLRSSGGLAGSGFTLRNAEIVYGPSGTPRSLRVEARLKEQALIIDTDVADGKAVSEVTQGETQQQVSHELAPDAVLLPNNVFAAAQGLAYRLVTMEPGATLPLYVAPQAQVQATLTAVGTERMQTADGMFDIRRHVVDVASPGAPLVLVLWAEARTGRMVRYSIGAAGVDVVREDLTSVFTRTVKEHRDNDQTLQIPAFGFNLAATVSRPAGRTAPDRKAKNVEKLPAIVLIGGSGHVDRDTIGHGAPVIGQLAGQLADAGFLVVRYDKRGVGQSGGRAETATLADYADDVIHVVRWLRKQKDVDDRRVTVVGHSEGGSIALLAATRTDDIRSVVTMAAPGTTGRELVLEQQRQALATLTIPEEEKQRRVALQTKIIDAVLSGQGWEDVPEAMRKQADTAWFRSVLAFDPAQVMPRVEQPLLVLHGERDRQVPLTSAEVLNGLALKRKKGTAALVMLPGLNHLLLPATTGEVSEYGSLGDAKVGPEVAKAIAGWLGGLPAR